MVSQDMLDVVLDLLRHFFFLESTGQHPRRVSSRIPWQEITAVLQEAFPGSQLAQIEPTKATAAVTERKKSFLRSEVLKSAGIPGDERERLSVFFPSKEFVRVPATECVTDAILRSRPEEGDDEPGVQFESEADEGIAEVDAAVPVVSAAPVPAPVAMVERRT